MKFADYYKVLGVSKNASQEEIRRAYRKLARKYHPDVNKEKKAENTFKQINEAYEILKNPEKKKLYDTYGHDWEQAESQPHSGWEDFSQQSGPQGYTRSFRFSNSDGLGDGVDLNEIFSNIFSGTANEFDSDFHSNRSFNNGTSQPQEAEITVSLHDAFYGAKKAISLKTYERDLNGQVNPVVRNLHVNIPKGVTNGSIIRLAGQSNGRNLHLKIIIAKDSQFSVDGHDLHTSVAVSPWEVALGAKIPVHTVGGTVNLSIPKGSQSGKKFKLRGKGIPRRKGDAGDLIVTLEIRVPDKLSRDEEKLFAELANTSQFNPRDRQHQRAKAA